MTTRIILLLGLSFITLRAGEASPEDLLRQGLFEEEANRDFDKATTAYQAVITAHDRQRAFAATATFRLGEIARKKSDKEAATAAFRTVAERFPEQAELARLSRENLSALGAAIADEAPSGIPDSEQAELTRLKEIVRNSPDLIDGAGSDGWKPIHHAATKGWIDVLAFLLENHVNPNSRTARGNFTPLQLASVHGQLASVKALLAAKADPSATFGTNVGLKGILPAPDPNDSYYQGGNWSALDLAIWYERREVFRALIEAGADITRVGPLVQNYGPELVTSLGLAIYRERNDLAQALIDAGAPLAGIGESIPPLHLAVEQNPEMVAPLLKAGADVNGRNADGETPLFKARQHKMLDFLLSNGADPNAKSKSGRTPLDLITASPISLSPMIESLLKHGATVEDHIALLRACSDENLSIVLERIVYPCEQRPDAILLSINGSNSIHADSSQLRHELITLETRSSPASPPPSLAEALCASYHYTCQLLSIRIMRRDAGQPYYEPLREWVSKQSQPLPKDWPALEWGDIVEVRTAYDYTEGLPSIYDLADLIPDRSITVDLGGFSYPVPIRGDYWMQNIQANETPLPRVEDLFRGISDLVNLSKATVRRKGVDQPIPVDFTKPSLPRFIFRDGDTLELAFDPEILDQKFSKRHPSGRYLLSQDTGIIDPFLESAATVFIDELINPDLSLDLANIAVLRRGDKWKVEHIDLEAWVKGLPPREKWEREGILNSGPKIQPGDVVILSDLADERSKIKRMDAYSKLMEVRDLRFEKSAQ